MYVVTGAGGYTGKYITEKLLSSGKQVRSLTGHPDRPHPFGNKISICPFNFERPEKLVDSLRGAYALFNTYWVRFEWKNVTFKKAIENTKVLIESAKKAGIKKIVHISITNPSKGSSLPYFRGKAEVEEFIIHSNISYAIIRPTIIFGKENILINNIAWALRRFPIFFIPSGSYRVQPIYVKDVARIAINSANEDENVIIDAAGPEIYTFYELVRLIAQNINSKAKIVPANPDFVYLTAKLLGYLVGDIMLTMDEIKGLVSNLLISQESPEFSLGKNCFSEWISQNAEFLGKTYLSELENHYI